MRSLSLSILLIALTVLGSFGFDSTFADRWYLIPALLGATAATLIVRAGRRLTMPLTFSLAMSVMVGASFATVLCLTVTTGDYLTAVTTLTSGWRDLLSVAEPVDSASRFLVIPFIVAWIGSAISGEIQARGRAAGPVLLGPALTLIVASLFAQDRARALQLQGGLFALGALSLLWAASWVSASGQRSRRLLASVAVVLIASAVGAAAGPLLLSDDRDRLELRDQVAPPFDLELLSSPLIDFKSNLIRRANLDASGTPQPVLFTIEGEQLPSRIRLAALDTYDGTVWSANRSRAAGDGLRVVGRTFPEVEGTGPEAPSTHLITIRELTGHFLPVPGVPTGLRLTGSDDALRIDEQTGNLLLENSLRAGLSYRVESVPTANGSATSIPPNALVDPDPELVVAGEIPPEISSAALAIVGDAETPIERATKLAEYFRTGCYSTKPKAGHSYLFLRAFLTNPGSVADSGAECPFQGYDEQYVALFGVMARSLQLPARVVVGWQFEEEPGGQVAGGSPNAVDITFDQIEAWAEIRFETVGWVAFDPTPPRDREAVENQEPTEVANRTGPAPIPPPPRTDDASSTTSSPSPVPPPPAPVVSRRAPVWVYASTGITVPVAVGVVIAAIIMFVKARRRRRRRSLPSSDARIAGAWQELLDLYKDLGFQIPKDATIRESVPALIEAARHPGQLEPSIRELAQRVEASAFSFNPPTDEQAAFAWESLSEVMGRLLAQHKIRERIRCQFSTRSLRTGRRRHRSRLTHGPALGEQTVLANPRNVDADTRVSVDA